MEYGLEIRDPNGVIMYSTDDVAWTSVASYLVYSGQLPINFTLPVEVQNVYTEYKAMSHPTEFMHPNTDSSKVKVSMSGATVYCSSSSQGTTVTSLILVLGR